MNEKLKKIIIAYIEDINNICVKLLKGLNLKTKVEFWEYREEQCKFEYKVSGVQYILHGAGCIATNDEIFLDWDFGYGSRWCGINPWLLAGTLEHNKDSNKEYYDSNIIKAECEKAVLSGEMYKKYNLYYFNIPDSEKFEPQFPQEFDTLIVEHYGSKWIIPRSKVVDRFIRKSKKVYNHIDRSLNLYTLTFTLEGKEVYAIPYDDIGYPENAIKIMREILINSEKKLDL